MTSIHFLRPYYFLALLPLLVLTILLFIKQRDNVVWRNICDEHLLKHLLIQRQRPQKRLLLFSIIMLTWIIAVTALAGPSWFEQKQTVYRRLNASIIVLDLSNAMFASDLHPNRITRAKYKVLDLLKRHQEGQIGMVAFAKEAYVVSPLTQDSKTIAAMIPDLDPNIMPVQGQNIAAGLTKAEKLLRQAGALRGHIILITNSSADKNAINTAKKLFSHGYNTSVIGIGSNHGAPIPTGHGFAKNKSGNIVLTKLDINSLRRLANSAGGSYHQFSNTDEDIESLLNTRTHQQAQRTQEKTKTWQDQGHWLVLLLLPFAAIGFRRGWLERVVC